MSNKNDLTHDLIMNHPLKEFFPHLLRGYKDGYLEAERVLEKLEKEKNPQYCPTCGQRTDW